MPHFENLIEFTAILVEWLDRKMFTIRSSFAPVDEKMRHNFPLPTGFPLLSSPISLHDGRQPKRPYFRGARNRFAQLDLMDRSKVELEHEFNYNLTLLAHTETMVESTVLLVSSR